ncbi:MAG: hypothetical protein QOG77_1329 [Solirubrobacteraceae bacterium]|jgi:hypothetical protein|nr:hypothetical protein [Solirubrobacteraceae bacterium]
MALQRITIGFQGSQVLTLKMDDADLDTLLARLPSGDWHDLTVDDGTVRANLSQIVYVKTDRDGSRVGFGA